RRGDQRARRLAHPAPAGRRAGVRAATAGRHRARPSPSHALPPGSRAPRRARPTPAPPGAPRPPRRPAWGLSPALARGLSDGRSRLSAPGPGAPRRALQLRDVPHEAAPRRRRSRPGDISTGVPVLASLPAGNPPPGLVVPNPEKHVPDVLPGPRARIAGRGGWRPRVGRPEVRW